MKITRFWAMTMISLAVLAPHAGIAASSPDVPGVSAQMVVTVRGDRPENLRKGDLIVLQGKARAPVVNVERLAGDLADMQLFVLLDDSTRSSSLGLQLPELKSFLESLPATTQVAIGYMRNGSFALAQAFTPDHRKATGALRIPMAIPGENGSPYFALSDLVKHWPSHETTGRRAVLMLTDGVDRYFGQAIIEDPYVEAATHDALKQGVIVYSIYLRGAGLYGRGAWSVNTAQSRLIELSEGTGGHAYFEEFTDPVSISPFLKDFRDRLENQYRVTIEASGDKGFQRVKVRTELPALKVDGPTQVYLR